MVNRSAAEGVESQRSVRRRLVSAAFATHRLPGLLATGARTIVNGAWLGVLTDAELAALDERYYDVTDLYRTDTWNERGLFDWERQLFDQQLDGCRTVAVLACGGGREVLALLDAGYDAVGFESHPALASFADGFLEARGHVNRVTRVARDSFPAEARSFDAVVIGWGGYSLVHGRSRRVDLLRRIADHASGPKRILLSVLERTGSGREERLTAAIANVVRRRRAADPCEMGDTLGPNLLHLFTERELLEELRAAGLEPTLYWHVGGGYDAGYACAAATVP